jgi:hypothetical protein
MKLIDHNANFMRFHFLETIYTQFHLDEASLLSFYINSLSCDQKSYVTTNLLKMKLGSSLRIHQSYHRYLS